MFFFLASAFSLSTAEAWSATEIKNALVSSQ
jgi:hypothetical protein